MAFVDYYKILGVDKNIPQKDVRAAYRKRAKQFHPDLHPNDPKAKAKFQALNEAYDVISDPDKRAKYDQYGEQWKNAQAYEQAGGGFGGFGGGGAGGGGGFTNMNMDDIFGSFGDIFGDLFGGGFGGGRSRRADPNAPQRGANLRTQVKITFEEACFGTEKEIEIPSKVECKTCGGSGAKAGTSPVKCERCGGRGQIVQTQQSLFGMVQNVTTCPACGGKGTIIKEKCPDCHGQGYTSKKEKLQVSIPAGIDHGQSVRLRGKGEPGKNGGARGDLLVEVYVERHKDFQRMDYDIYSTVRISYPRAVLGGDVVIPTIDGDVAYNVKAGTQTGTRVRLRGKGVPSLRNRKMRGNHYVDLVVDVPTKLTKEQKKLLEQLDKSIEDEENKKNKKHKK